MGFIKEFKDFALRGNVMDLAVAVVIGSAFNKIITAVVDAVFMPIIAMLTGDINKFDEKMVGPIKIGLLFHAVLDFAIIAFALFLMVKGINRFRTKVVPEAPVPTTSELLLADIRDELRKK